MKYAEQKAKKFSFQQTKPTKLHHESKKVLTRASNCRYNVLQNSECFILINYSAISIIGK